jgi:hypothetical protein
VVHRMMMLVQRSRSRGRCYPLLRGPRRICMFQRISRYPVHLLSLFFAPLSILLRSAGCNPGDGGRPVAAGPPGPPRWVMLPCWRPATNYPRPNVAAWRNATHPISMGIT